MDLRYSVPDRIEKVSVSLIKSNGYDFIDTEDGGPGPLMGIWLEVENAKSRSPRMILGFDVAQDKTSQRIQQIVDSAPEARRYCTDGYVGYLDVVYPGRHI